MTDKDKIAMTSYLIDTPLRGRLTRILFDDIIVGSCRDQVQLNHCYTYRHQCDLSFLFVKFISEVHYANALDNEYKSISQSRIFES